MAQCCRVLCHNIVMFISQCCIVLCHNVAVTCQIQHFPVCTYRPPLCLQGENIRYLPVLPLGPTRYTQRDMTTVSDSGCLMVAQSTPVFTCIPMAVVYLFGTLHSGMLIRINGEVVLLLLVCLSGNSSCPYSGGGSGVPYGALSASMLSRNGQNILMPQAAGCLENQVFCLT